MSLQLYETVLFMLMCFWLGALDGLKLTLIDLCTAEIVTFALNHNCSNRLNKLLRSRMYIKLLVIHMRSRETRDCMPCSHVSSFV